MHCINDALKDRDNLRDLRLEKLRREIQKVINNGEATPLNIEDIKGSRRY
jgi:antitoxin ParD1/3/4